MRETVQKIALQAAIEIGAGLFLAIAAFLAFVGTIQTVSFVYQGY